jgi:hypothetical protein
MKELFEKMDAYKLTFNQLRYLYKIKVNQAIQTNYAITITHDEFDGLKEMGYLEEALKLSDRGFALVLEFESLFKITKKKKGTVTAEEMGYIKKYNEIFPDIKIPTSGKRARSHERDVAANFSWFLANYNYSWDTILQATELYVASLQKQNYKFMRTSEYFVRKQDPDKTFKSELASYCASVESGEITEEPKHFSPKIV